MVFVKIVKSKAYFKRFQVKWRRRREGKTDYRARKRLINQEKNKYFTPKYRLVVRFTNKDVMCQIISAKIVGDVVHCVAYSHELPRYGLPGPIGLTNYAAAYCTGLLCARRMLAKVGLADKYAGKKDVSGDKFLVEPVADGPRPFKALLDVGLKRTTTGARVFGVLKGACDGGLYVPHSEKRFPGYDKEGKSYDAEKHKARILGAHVADYMKSLQGEDAERFQTQFARYIKAGVKAEGLADLYKKVHANIRKDPSYKKVAAKPHPKPAKKWQRRRITLSQRKDRLSQKKKAYLKKKAQE